MAVANHIAEATKPQQAVDMVAPRAANSVLWKLVLANCYMRANAHDQALATAEAAMPAADGLTPDDRRSLNRTTATLYMTATPPQGARAVALLRSVLADRPDDVDALNNAACALAEMVTPPRPQEALTYSTHAYDLVHNAGQVNPYISDTYAWTLILAGKVDDGIEVLHQVVDQADFPDARYHLAMAYLRKSPPQPADAKRELNSATMKYTEKPTDPAMRAKIEAAQKVTDDLISKALEQDKSSAGVNP